VQSYVRAVSHLANPFRIFYQLKLRALAQPGWLKRLAAFDVVRQRSAHLSDKSTLIFGIAQGSRGELGGAQIEIGAGEFRVLAHGVARCDRFVPNDLGRRRALLQELLFLEDPLVAEHTNVLFRQLSITSTLVPLDGHTLATGTLQDDLVPDLRLGEGLGYARSISFPQISRVPSRVFGLTKYDASSLGSCR
jgi:hypothetical protein